jgi:hypothetical protein
MTPVGFEPTISAGERPMTYAIDRAATGTCDMVRYFSQISTNVKCFVVVVLSLFQSLLGYARK